MFVAKYSYSASQPGSSTLCVNQPITRKRSVSKMCSLAVKEGMMRGKNLPSRVIRLETRNIYFQYFRHIPSSIYQDQVNSMKSNRNLAISNKEIES